MEYETKECKKCNLIKTLSEFYKDGKRYKSSCKECIKKYVSLNYTNNKTAIKEKQKNYYINNKENLQSNNKKYYSENKEKFSEYHIENREHILEKQKQYRDKNKDKIKEIKNNYRIKNKDKIKEYRDKYYEKNKETILRQNRERNKINSHIVAWRTVLKNQLRRMGSKKEGKTIDLLGYSALDLKFHIETLFTEGMTWDNYGKWEIDHKLPVTSFLKDTLPSIVNALENLQPLWQSDNRSKYNKF